MRCNIINGGSSFVVSATDWMRYLVHGQKRRRAVEGLPPRSNLRFGRGANVGFGAERKRRQDLSPADIGGILEYFCIALGVVLTSRLP